MTAERLPASVVIPACDRRELLRECLDALRGQTRPPGEVIVVDDCSADGTPEMLAEYARVHPELGLKALRNETHRGANPSRNRGLEKAQGDFVAFLDCDCMARPDWLERLMEGFTGPRVAAVSGLVEDPPPTNLFERTFKGTHRLHRDGPAHRLVAGNLCVRREVALGIRLDEDRAAPLRDRTGRPDTSVSGRGDEEGLFLLLRAAGWEIRAATRAVVLHRHSMTGSRFFRQAFRGGRSAARLVYKYRLRHRLDLLPFLLGYGHLPLGWMNPRLLVVSGLFFTTGIGALLYNDLVRKGKTPWETLSTFPLLLVYYHLRLAGYLFETVRLRLGPNRPGRVDLRAVPSAFPPGESE